ncbi:unnamed protein product, partial [Mesorhabditis belari]|uniref:Uncharacterized protein n=1 Tax=Mesorhabditis belari TaxID=2138241 RepID=A0AAF3EVP8_9BILA
MPKKPNYVEIRRKTWNKIIESFEYLTACAIALWKVVDLDRLEMLVNWSYLALQFSDVCDDETLMKLKLAKDEVSENLCATVLLENGHLVGERAATLERNLVDTALRKGTSIARIMEKSNPITELPTSKKPRMADG